MGNLNDIRKQREELETKLADLRRAEKEAVEVEAEKQKEQVISALNDLAKTWNGTVSKKYDTFISGIERLRNLNPRFIEGFDDPFEHDLLARLQPDTSMLQFFGWVAKKEKYDGNLFA